MKLSKSFADWLIDVSLVLVIACNVVSFLEEHWLEFNEKKVKECFEQQTIDLPKP